MTIRVPLVQPGTRPELAGIEASIMQQRGRISPLYQVLLNSAPLASARCLPRMKNWCWSWPT